MVADPIFFKDLAYVFVAALIGGILAHRMGQPLILGYVIGGILISPLTPGPSISDAHSFELLAEIGVILLMFCVGIEFSVADLLRVRWVALIGGPLGILLSILLAIAVGSLFGWSTTQSAVIGAVVSVASTMVLARLLLDRGELRTKHGKVMIGITLVEDLAVVILTVLLPTLSDFGPDRLPVIGRTLLTALLVLAPFLFLAAKVIPLLLTRVAQTQNQELFLLVALAIGIGTAAVTQLAGLSLALGAFLSGLIISGSEYGHEALARLLPIRDAFVALFFVTIGALIDPTVVFANLPLLLGMLALIVPGKFLIWALVVRLFRYSWGTACLVGLGLTQIGEFSFVLVQVAKSAGHVGEDVYSATLAASLVSILANVFLFRYVPAWVSKFQLSAERKSLTPDLGTHDGFTQHVVLCGFGRVGSTVGQALDYFRIPYVVIERDPDIVRTLRRRSVPCLYGDASHGELLKAAGAERAVLGIIALPELDRVMLCVRRFRGLNRGIPLLARAHGPREAEELRAAGADEVIQPEIEAAHALIRHALRSMSIPSDRALSYLEKNLTGGSVSPGRP